MGWKYQLGIVGGFADSRLVDDSPIAINNAKLKNTIISSGNENLEFYSATYHLHKLDNFACEDYGQAVIYKGTIQPNTQVSMCMRGSATSTYTLDEHHVFEAGKIHPVWGNTYCMLYCHPKLKDHFEYISTFDKHYGIFEGCGSSLLYDRVLTTLSTGDGSGSCCSLKPYHSGKHFVF